MRQTVVQCHVQHTKMLFLKAPNLNIYAHTIYIFKLFIFYKLYELYTFIFL